LALGIGAYLLALLHHSSISSLAFSHLFGCVAIGADLPPLVHNLAVVLAFPLLTLRVLPLDCTRSRKHSALARLVIA
jgi:hypothetical protein